MEMGGNLMFLLMCALVLFVTANGDSSIDEYEESGRYIVEGKVYSPEILSSDVNWQRDTHIIINDGEYKGFLREDGTFQISSIPSGSYVVEVMHPDYYYEPVRVEINPKGKFRARKVSYVQPGQIIQVPYPLKFKSLARYRYFQTRETLKVTDFLFSPMVLMMLLPLILMLILPKMMSDPETKKEMDNLNLSKVTNDIPEISEMITSFFSGGQPKPVESKEKKQAVKSNKKRN